MTAASPFHWGKSLSLIGLLVDEKTVISNDGTDLVFLLLASNAKDLVVNLDTREVFR